MTERGIKFWWQLIKSLIGTCRETLGKALTIPPMEVMVENQLLLFPYFL